VLFYVLGAFLGTLGFLSGVGLAAYALWVGNPSGATAVMVSLAIQLGIMLTLFGMLFDFEHNRPLNQGERGRRVDPVRERELDPEPEPERELVS
jgi:hypothetical protein